MTPLALHCHTGFSVTFSLWHCSSCSSTHGCIAPDFIICILTSLISHTIMLSTHLNASVSFLQLERSCSWEQADVGLYFIKRKGQASLEAVWKRRKNLCGWYTCILTAQMCVFVCLVTAESMKDPFGEAELLPMLKKMLEDPVGAVEVKFSALGLICSLANSSKFDFTHSNRHGHDPSTEQLWI